MSGMSEKKPYVPKRFRVRQRKVYPGDRRMRPHAVKIAEAREERVRNALDLLDWSMQQSKSFDLYARAVLDYKPFPLVPGQTPADAVRAATISICRLLPATSVRTITELVMRPCAYPGQVPLAEVPAIVRSVIASTEGGLLQRPET